MLLEMSVAKVFDRRMQRSYRKRKKTTLVDFDGSDTMKVLTETGFGYLTKPENMCYLY